MPSSAFFLRVADSKEKGRLTTPTVRAPDSFAIWATIVEAPVPVPPPMATATKTRSARLHRLGDLLSALLGSLAAQVGVRAGAEAADHTCADCYSIGYIKQGMVFGATDYVPVLDQREGEVVLVHAAHRVGAAAAHAEYLD